MVDLWFCFVAQKTKKKKRKRKKSGEAGHRSPYPSHAKRVLYHLSYYPDEGRRAGMQYETQTWKRREEKRREEKRKCVVWCDCRGWRVERMV